MYRKLALQNIQNNKQYYLPYMISCIFMVMTFYTIYSLAMNPNIQEMMGGDEMQLMLRFGVIVIALFSIIFYLLYKWIFNETKNKGVWLI